MIALAGRAGLGGFLPQLVTAVAPPLGVLELPESALPLPDLLHGPVLDGELYRLGQGDGPLLGLRLTFHNIDRQHRAPKSKIFTIISSVPTTDLIIPVLLSLIMLPR